MGEMTRELAALPHMSVAELAERYEAVYGEPVIRVYKADDKENAAEFAGNFDSLGMEAYRIVNGADIVARLPRHGNSAGNFYFYFYFYFFQRRRYCCSMAPPW